MPILNLTVSVLSVSAFVKGCAIEKFNGPITVNQSTPKPTDEVFKDKWIIVVLPTLTVYNCLQWIEYWQFFDGFFNE